MEKISFRHLVPILLFLAAMARPALAQKPNILVILTDDEYFRGIGYNNPEVKTPNLDKLAGEGLICNRAYVASPICAASRAAMMTGVYPEQNGVISLDATRFSDYQAKGPRAKQTLGFRLSQAGYHTAFWGKSHLGDPKTYGFSEGAELGDLTDSATFAMADSFLNGNAAGAQPFFLWLAPHQPHVPLLPAAKWLALYDEKTFKIDSNFRVSPLQESINNQGLPGQDYYRDSDYRNNWLSMPAGPPRSLDTIQLFKKAYYATISHLDDQIGRLVQRLKDKNLYDKTAILFLSDNGYHLGTHGLGNKLTMHEESVRIPLFIRWNGISAKGRRSNALVSSLDLYPTLMEIAGIAAPAQLMGKSLLPLLRDPDAVLRDVVFSEAVGVGGKPGQGQRMARGDAWKYVLTDINEQYLFDENADRWELHNLWPAKDSVTGAIAGKLRQAAADWMRDIGDRPFPYPTGVGTAPGKKFGIRDFQGTLFLDIPAGETASVRLISLIGGTSRAYTCRGRQRIRKPDLPAGVYLLRIRTHSLDRSFTIVLP